MVHFTSNEVLSNNEWYPLCECEFEMDDNTRYYILYSSRTTCGFLTSHRLYYMCKGLKDGFIVKASSRKQESLTVFRRLYKDNTFYSVKDPECWTRKNLNRSGLPLCRVALTQQPGNIRLYQVNDITECWDDHLQHFVTNLALTRQRSTRRSPREGGGGGGGWVSTGHFIKWTYCA